jgi:hypothetical protein
VTGTERQRLAWLLRRLSKCSRDGLFKSRPSAACSRCGDCPLGVGQDERDYDNQSGFTELEAELVRERWL